MAHLSIEKLPSAARENYKFLRGDICACPNCGRHWKSNEEYIGHGEGSFLPGDIAGLKGTETVYVGDGRSALLKYCRSSKSRNYVTPTDTENTPPVLIAFIDETGEYGEHEDITRLKAAITFSALKAA